MSLTSCLLSLLRGLMSKLSLVRHSRTPRASNPSASRSQPRTWLSWASLVLMLQLMPSSVFLTSLQLDSGQSVWDSPFWIAGVSGGGETDQPHPWYGHDHENKASTTGHLPLIILTPDYYYFIVFSHPIYPGPRFLLWYRYALAINYYCSPGLPPQEFCEEFPRHSSGLSLDACGIMSRSGMAGIGWTIASDLGGRGM